MAHAPVYDIDPAAFYADPYPDLEILRAEAPLAFVPQLGATLMTRRDDIFANEKRIDLFSSDQPGGLMTVLMGENMMRKDGDAHANERRATFPAFSPRTVRDKWLAAFRDHTQLVLDEIEPKGGCDLVADYAMPVSGHALRVITGLRNMSWQEVDRVSQGMIDGVSNYAGHAEVEKRCLDCVATIDAHIDAAIEADGLDEMSLLAVQRNAQLSMASVRANIKLAISGGQNEPRDAIAGTVWALLQHPEQLAMVRDGRATWRDAFEEFARWISPIGMSPRRVARDEKVMGVQLETDTRLFFMFGSGNRDERVFDDPKRFDITRDTSPSIAFGAGPHFCAGAAASRALIAEVALPMLFDRFPNMRVVGDVDFQGWAFRGPKSVPVEWG